MSKQSLSPPFSAPASPLALRGSLPTVYRDRENILLRVGSDYASFVEIDMDVSRLNKLHRFMWLAGRPGNIRPLHQQKLMGREILTTEQVDLHMVWHASRIFIKPLPDYMFEYQMWEAVMCNNTTLHDDSCGFLLSYIWMLRSPSDFRIAVELGLISSDLHWNGWRALADEVLSNMECGALGKVNRRYQYGELRLSRLNIIYRILYISNLKRFVQGYKNTYNRYSPFYERTFGWILLVILFINLILSAMQVGLGTTKLSRNEIFQQASYGFVVFSMVLPVTVIIFGLLLFLWLFTFHLLGARNSLNSRGQVTQVLVLRSQTEETP